MSELQKIKVEDYDGTMESLENLVENLNLESHDYHFDVMAKTIFIIKNGLVLRPGDCYQVPIPNDEKFEAIG